MTINRRLPILTQAGTPRGVFVGFYGLTHHEAETGMPGMLERRDSVAPGRDGVPRLTIRYHLTAEGRRYLSVMQVPPHAQG
jgi:hypothetical protein